MDKKGSGFIPISLKYLRHRLLARHRNGHGLHSPFVYDLVRNVIYNKNRWKVPDRLPEYHRELQNNDTILTISDLGAGSRVHNSEIPGRGTGRSRQGRHTGKEGAADKKSADGISINGTGDGSPGTGTGSSTNGPGKGEEDGDSGKNMPDNGRNETRYQERKVSSIVRHSSVTPRQGALLFRLSKWYRPVAVVEAGTGLGIGTSYLAAGAENAAITTIEGSPAKHHFAQEHTDVAASGGLEFLLGTFDTYFDELVAAAPDRTMFFIDGDHRYQPTLSRVRSVLANPRLSETMIILDDIYWSHEMARAWKEACAEPGVDISIDLFHMGILIRRPGISRQHFRISF